MPPCDQQNPVYTSVFNLRVAYTAAFAVRLVHLGGIEFPPTHFQLLLEHGLKEHGPNGGEVLHGSNFSKNECSIFISTNSNMFHSVLVAIV